MASKTGGGALSFIPVSTPICSWRFIAGTIKANHSAKRGGVVRTLSAKGTALVGLNATAEGQEGTVTTYQLNGKPLVAIGSTEVGHEGMAYPPGVQADAR